MAGAVAAVNWLRLEKLPQLQSNADFLQCPPRLTVACSQQRAFSVILPAWLMLEKTIFQQLSDCATWKRQQRSAHWLRLWQQLDDKLSKEKSYEYHEFHFIHESQAGFYLWMRASPIFFVVSVGLLG